MAEAMFQTRTIGTEKMFKQLCNKTGVGKGMLKVGDCFLPSKVDKLYHRNILTSNLAEASFSTLKNKLNSITQPSLTLIKELIDMSDDWMRHSKQEMRENIPRILKEKHITFNIGNWALRVLTKEYQKFYQMKSTIVIRIYINSHVSMTLLIQPKPLKTLFPKNILHGKGIEKI